MHRPEPVRWSARQLSSWLSCLAAAAAFGLLACSSATPAGGDGSGGAPAVTTGSGGAPGGTGSGGAATGSGGAPGGSGGGLGLDGGAEVGANGGNPGPSMTVTAFQGTYVYFTPTDNKRIIDAPVTFPEMPATFQQIMLNLALRCPPAGGCDFWDRRAFIGIVNGSGDGATVTEIARFMTPYRVSASWTLDVTALRPLLSGTITMRVFIDTWVGPMNAQGGGWLVDASFDMKGGVPAKEPLAVIRLWDETAVDYGDPAKPTTGAAPDRMITIPPEATSVELRSFITGHGQGNAENCAEFCGKSHTFTVGGMPVQRLVWRTDCATTAVRGQAGTYQYPRAGWCPGAMVAPWVADVTAAAQPGAQIPIAYSIAAYENTCRPDAPMCSGCTLGGTCAYDGGGHTAPFFDLSAVLIAYR